MPCSASVLASPWLSWWFSWTRGGRGKQRHLPGWRQWRYQVCIHLEKHKMFILNFLTVYWWTQAALQTAVWARWGAQDPDQAGQCRKVHRQVGRHARQSINSEEGIQCFRNRQERVQCLRKVEARDEGKASDKSASSWTNLDTYTIL